MCVNGHGNLHPSTTCKSLTTASATGFPFASNTVPWITALLSTCNYITDSICWFSLGHTEQTATFPLITLPSIVLYTIKYDF